MKRFSSLLSELCTIAKMMEINQSWRFLPLRCLDISSCVWSSSQVTSMINKMRQFVTMQRQFREWRRGFQADCVFVQGSGCQCRYEGDVHEDLEWWTLALTRSFLNSLNRFMWWFSTEKRSLNSPPRKRPGKETLCQFSSPLSTSEVSKTATVILSGVMSILPQQKKILLLKTSLQKIASPNAWQLENVTDELPRVACGDALSHAEVPVFNRLVSNPRPTGDNAGDSNMNQAEKWEEWSKGKKSEMSHWQGERDWSWAAENGAVAGDGAA